MKHLILGFMFVFLTSVATAQTETDWQTLLTKSGSKVIAVEGATKIDISTAKTLHERGVRFVDARTWYSWKYGHIPGASHFTDPDLMGTADKNEELVYYCDCAGSPTCNRSPKEAARAVASGFQNVYYLTKFKAWSAAGHPLETAE